MSVGRTEQEWLEAIRTSVLRGDLPAARESIARARADHPHSIELRRTQAGIHQQSGRITEAESLLPYIRPVAWIAPGFACCSLEVPIR